MSTPSSGRGERITVLVGFAEASAAPEVVWSLVDEGYDVVAFARRGRASALRHSHHVVCHEVTAPETSLEATLREIQRLLVSLDARQDRARRVLFPLDDTAVWLCSRIQLGHGWLMAGPSGASAELALNKHLQTRLARDAGFKVPTTALVQTVAQLKDFSDAEGFPIILKPAECVPTLQSRLIQCRKWICADRSELDRAVADWKERVPLLAQAFIAGTGEGVFGLAAPEGIRAWSGHRRLRMMNPQGSGSSACVSQPVPPDVRTKVEALLENVCWRGLFMVELLRDRFDNLWFVELNGRPWGSMALSRRQGFEYPAWHLKLAVDQQAQVGIAVAPTPGLVCRHVGRELMHLLFVLRGPKSRALRRWPSVWKAMTDVIHVSQRDSLYNWRREDPKVFVADCYYTLHDHLFKPTN
jgi:hypothetical protein